jgi:hypothetical protein
MSDILHLSLWGRGRPEGAGEGAFLRTAPSKGPLTPTLSPKGRGSQRAEDNP